MRKLTIGFIGLGLIGGSMARILKHNLNDVTIIGYNRSKASLDEAVKDGIIDVPLQEVGNEFAACDYIFLCTPVELNSMFLGKLKEITGKNTVITDVGSVKGFIHKTAKELDIEDRFIGGHPMAGSEKTGYSSSSDHLLENAYYAITPCECTKKEAVDEYKELVKIMGAIPVVVDPIIHDYCVAGISHLPHIIASSLVNTVKAADTEEGTMKMLAAGGFKDITRIASSSPVMWEQICMTNSEKILELTDAFSEQLKLFKNALITKDKDTINHLFESSRDYRNSVNMTSKGLIEKLYILKCELVDQKGQLAKVATLLSDNDINLKNVGIIKNRENEKGVLHIEFADQEDLDKACEVLKNASYTVYSQTT